MVLSLHGRVRRKSELTNVNEVPEEARDATGRGRAHGPNRSNHRGRSGCVPGLSAPDRKSVSTQTRVGWCSHLTEQPTQASEAVASAGAEREAERAPEGAPTGATDFFSGAGWWRWR